MESKNSEQRKHRGGHVIKHEPPSAHHILSSPFIRKSFEYVRCLKFCQRIEELKYHNQLTSAFATKIKKDKVTIGGVQFTVSRKIISAATGITNTREIWLKREYLDLKNYNMYLKEPYKGAPTYIFPFKHFLERYTPLMKIIMKKFTCESRYSRVYKYYMKILMHFTGVQQINLSRYLYKSLIEMREMVQKLRENHHTSLFHHGLVKVVVFHELAQENLSWDHFSSSSSPLSPSPTSSDETTPSSS